MIVQPIPDVFFIQKKKRAIREKGLKEGEKKVLTKAELYLLLVILKKLLKVEVAKNIKYKQEKEEREERVEKQNKKII